MSQYNDVVRYTLHHEIPVLCIGSELNVEVDYRNTLKVQDSAQPITDFLDQGRLLLFSVQLISVFIF